MLSVRIRPLLNDFINPMRASFPPGRVASDNIIAQELLHSARKHIKVAVVEWLLKRVNSAKAYNRVYLKTKE